MKRWSILLLVFFISGAVFIAVFWKVNADQSAAIHAKMIAKKKKEIKHQKCYNDTCYSVGLNDNVTTYLEASYFAGTRKFLNRKSDIHKLVALGKLVEVKENEYCVLDTMYYSYPFLTPKAKNLLDEIGENFHKKLENTGLECSRFIVTSILRTTNSVARLRRKNRNSIRNSSHLHGTTFDISYRVFVNDKALSSAQCMYLGDMLAKTIHELRRKEKCWATYETWQTCFHVVAR